jgi:hypothetical protein
MRKAAGILLLFFVTPLLIAQTCPPGQLLQGFGFELSTPNGTFPDSGFWTNSHAPVTAGAITTTTAARTGSNGLWEFTGSEGGAYWSGPYQEFSAAPGNIYLAQAWVRTPPPATGATWITGSRALVRVQFLDSARSVIAAFDSPAVTVANSGWQQLSVQTSAASAATAFVRFVCYLERSCNVTGVSVANFDDCCLALTGTVMGRRR